MSAAPSDPQATQKGTDVPQPSHPSSSQEMSQLHDAQAVSTRPPQIASTTTTGIVEGAMNSAKTTLNIIKNKVSPEVQKPTVPQSPDPTKPSQSATPHPPSKDDRRFGPSNRNRATHNSRSQQYITLEQYESLRDDHQNLYDHYLRSQERVSSLEVELSDLNTALQSTEDRLHSAREELRASRAFVSSEGNLDAQHLIKMVRDLNTAMDDFAYQFEEALPEKVKSTKVTKEQFEAMLGHQHISNMIKPWCQLVFSKGGTVGDFLLPFVQHSLCVEILQRIFLPYSPGSKPKDDDPWWTVSQRVVKGEPQERWARWRAISYTHARSDPTTDSQWCSAVEDKFLRTLIHKLTFILPPDTLPNGSAGVDHLKNSIETKVAQVFLDAIKVQDTIKMQYMSFDYETFMAGHDVPFDPTTMETGQEVKQGAKSKESNAILTVGLGLKAAKNVNRGGRIDREENLIIRSFVICGSWSPQV